MAFPERFLFGFAYHRVGPDQPLEAELCVAQADRSRSHMDRSPRSPRISN